MDWTAIGSGFGVGAIVGITGVGGGSLMTPLLLTVYKLNPAIAIGTDLWFAALTKVSGSVAHARHGHVKWRITRLLLSGSIPASIVTVLLMQHFGYNKSGSGTLTFSLGIALLLTAVVVAFKQSWNRIGLRLERWIPESRKAALTVLSGLILGVLVSLSSIGAGAIGATLILLIYPRLESRYIVGSDIAHAVPLTLVAGIGHAAMGNVDWTLLASLVIGSLPGIWLGAHLTRRLPDRVIRTLLCLSLITAGWKVIH
ncbi:MAG: sulfite exporter TauE/SafE family protein [Burkholderiaceae bacterium]|nr:sulfite exporter TauE/SafE family protein [Roseateles sp.]MBV8470568.1 sulfite exporter TauE/SafE family protein [Burkholderiaceae bacterium]